MKRSLLIVCILIFGLLLCGCVNDNSNNAKDMLPADKYVAIYEEYTVNSKLIGNTPYKPGPPFWSPTPFMPSDYDNSSGIMGQFLASYGYNVNDSFKILYGKRFNYDNPVVYGQGGFHIAGIYELPYAIDEGFTIVNISKNGTIYATYDNQSIYLKVGDTWASSITTRNETGRYYTYDIPNQTTGNITYFDWPVQTNTSFKIANKGIYGKALLNSTYTNK
jgi:hypothetical protein